MSDITAWFLALGGAFVAGLAGSTTHCLAMCGGISAALGAHSSRQHLVWLYQAGRVLGYGLIGGLGAALAGGLVKYSGWRSAGLALRWLLAAALLLIGLHLITGWRWFDRLSTAGQAVWRRIAPFAGRLLPPRHAGHALVLGLLWGWLPCGLVYAMLPAAWVSGDAWRGASLMIAFGLGTVPAMGLTAFGSQRLGAWRHSRHGRHAAGWLLIAAALANLLLLSGLGGAHHTHGSDHHSAHHAPAGELAKGATFAALPISAAKERLISPGHPWPGLAGCFSTAC